MTQHRYKCQLYDQVYSLKKQTQLQTTTKTDRQKTNRERKPTTQDMQSLLTLPFQPLTCLPCRCCVRWSVS